MNIFVSVGTQLPFERMLSMVEAVFSNMDVEISYQIGDSNFSAKKGIVNRYLLPEQYEKEFEKCDIFISHAGMGSIITALETGKNIIIVPRKFSLNEHRNDHQFATAEKFKDRSLVHVVTNTDEMLKAVEYITQNAAKYSPEISDPDENLLKFLEDFINA